MTQEGTNYINELKAMFCTLAFALTKRDGGTVEWQKKRLRFIYKKNNILIKPC